MGAEPKVVEDEPVPGVLAAGEQLRHRLPLLLRGEGLREGCAAHVPYQEQAFEQFQQKQQHSFSSYGKNYAVGE